MTKTGLGYEVFLSYASEDAVQATAIAELLEQADISCFFAPKSIRPGDAFNDVIRDALRTSRQLWLIVTPRSIKSEWVTSEWSAAWVLETPVVPILLGCAPDCLPERLRGLHCIDYQAVAPYIAAGLQESSSRAYSTPGDRARSELRTQLAVINPQVVSTIDSGTQSLEVWVSGKNSAELDRLAAKHRPEGLLSVNDTGTSIIGAQELGPDALCDLRNSGLLHKVVLNTSSDLRRVDV